MKALAINYCYRIYRDWAKKMQVAPDSYQYWRSTCNWGDRPPCSCETCKEAMGVEVAQGV